MAVEFDIVIPSMGRADRVISKGAITHGIICVPEAEAEAYAEHNPGMKIETHPDDLKGLTRKRQWILEHHPNCFQLDDDCKCIKRVYIEKGEKEACDPDEAYDIIQYIGNCAKLAGCYYFGLGKEVNPLAYNEFQPIALTGIINGSCGFVEGSKLYYNPKAVLSEDYWMAGLNAYLYRKCWIDKRFAEVGAPYAGNPGGCANYRTVDQEKADTLFLRQCFGEAIKLKEDTKLATRKYDGARTLTIPF